MCKYEENVKSMTFENCNLIKRSFTTQGFGYTFNNEREDKLIKKEFRSTELSPNRDRNPSLMKSTYSKHSLTVVIENNAEEIEMYERSLQSRNNKIDDRLTKGQIDNQVKKPKQFTVSLHNPKEPADKTFIPYNSIKIPLGYSTTLLISAKAREIDEGGETLSESQRMCRLDVNTETLDVFNVYTRMACLFECKMKYSIKKCGCTPWNYPVKMEDNVSIYKKSPRGAASGMSRCHFFG